MMNPALVIVGAIRTALARLILFRSQCMSGSFKKPERVSVAVLTRLRWAARAKAAEDSDAATIASRSTARGGASAARRTKLPPGVTAARGTRGGEAAQPAQHG